MALTVVLLSVLFAAESGNATQPVVAIHDSEYTRALENQNATGATPTGPGTTGRQWWPTDWHYFVMPEAIKESLRSDGTAFTVVGDSNILAGALLTNGVPKYPILISLAAEAVHDNQIAALTNYVAAGGFLFIGSSSFTRNTNGTTRGNFALADQMGVSMVVPGLTNWVNNSTYTKIVEHRLHSHVPGGTLTWRLPSASEEIPYGVAANPPAPHDNNQAQAPHDLWQVTNLTATVLAQAGATPFLTMRQYGKGYFIYYAPMQPLLGNGGWAPTLYSYLTFRRAIEWAFEQSVLPIAKVSPWPYQYDAAFMVRHDLESFSNAIAGIEASAQFEFNNGASGDYYFCTGTLRQDMSPTYNTNDVVASLRRAITNYGAIIGPHNGGLTNPMIAGTPAAYDYWHWGPDEVLNLTSMQLPAGYSSGSNYAYTSLSRSFQDIESWLPGLMTNGMRAWCGPYYNSTREGSLNIQSALGVKITGEQKVGPFPHWSLSTQVANKRFTILQQPPSEWFVGSQMSHSMEAGHTVGTIRSQADFYYNLGGLLNQYSHTLSTGLGPAAGTATEYVVYAMNTNRFPRLWSANAIKIYNWWQQRSNVQMTVTVTTNGAQINTTCAIRNSANTNTTIELLTPASSQFCNLEVYTNGVLAGTNLYRIAGAVIKLRVGTTVTNAQFRYFPLGGANAALVQNFDGVSVPNLPLGWTTGSSGAQTPWVTQAATPDTAPNSSFVGNPASIGISDLISPVITLAAGQAQLSFRNNYDLEAGVGGVGFDGGVLEIKIGAGNFTDILAAGGSFASGGYNSTIDSSFASPITGRLAWSGNSGGYITTTVNLPAFTSQQDIQLRWRCATDNGGTAVGWQVDSITLSNSVCLCCISGTNAPVLPVQTNRTVNELSTLTVTNTATDADPNETLFYALQNPPSGAIISGGGIITWTPSVAFGGTTNALTTIVTDSSDRKATNSFNVIVQHVNTAPVLPGQTNRTITELATLIVTNTATDSDLPANTLSYSLLVAPGGASISASGIITWPTSEANGPGNFNFTTRVVDNGSPALSATNTFTVTVTEVNSAPILPGQGNRTINEAAALIVTNTASDGDLPANALSYQLVSPPAGAAISFGGIITWTPTESQGPSTNVFTTVVTDNGVPIFGATNVFTVVVNEVNSAPSFTAAPTNQTIAELTSLTITNAAADADVPTNILTYTLLGPATATIDTNTGVITWTPGEADGPGPNTFTTIVSDGSASSTNSFNVVVMEVNQAPLLPAQTNQTIAELAVLTVTNTATDDDLPANNLVYQLINPPSGASISGLGIITWIPTEAQGPSSATFTTVVSDGITSATNSFIVNVTETNQAPVLPVQSNRNLAELARLIVTNTATDADLPANPLTYQLVNPPTNALISASGVITWIPSVVQGTSTNTFTTIVNDGTASATNSFTVTVGDSLLGLATNITLISTGAVWSYLDNGSDQGSSWQNLALDASSWSNGSAQLGYGDGDEQTVVSFGPNSNAKFITTYFRRVFNVVDRDFFSGLNLRLLRDDGVVIYLNGTEVFRNNLPASAINYQTLALAAIGGVDESTFLSIPLDPGALVDGTNLIAVELHQNAPSSTDLSFDLELTGVLNLITPALAVKSDTSIAELTTLTVTNTATDLDTLANGLTYQLLNPPGNANISASGVITWTPGESEGPGNAALVTVVSDGVLSATNSFLVTVTEVNQSPVLPVQTNRVMAELSLLTVTNTATDIDLPANGLTYQLVNAPGNAAISASGVITWTPGESEGPGNAALVTVVSDGVLSATNSFTVTVTEVNQAPVLPVQTNRTMAELTLLTVTNMAADGDLPANVLTYQLVNALGNANISASGVITWTPGESEGPGAFDLVTVVSDGSVSVTNSFTVTVTEVNQAPVLPGQTNRTIAELSLLTVTNTATDGDFPANALSYQLISAPVGLSITAGGVISWTPDEAAGPGTNTVTTVVFDGVVAVTNSFQVIVTEANTAPTLNALTSRTVHAGGTVTFTALATDNDTPAQQLSFSLLNTPPVGASINGSSGLFEWVTGAGDENTTNTITVQVADDGTPQLSDAEGFVVTVIARPQITNITLTNGVVAVTWSSIAGQAYRLQRADALTTPTWQDVGADVTATGSSTTQANAVSGSDVRFYRVRLAP